MDEFREAGSPTDPQASKSDVLSGMLQTICNEQALRHEAQKKTRNFLFSYKIAARRVRAVTARPGLQPSSEQLSNAKTHREREVMRTECLTNAVNVLKDQVDTANRLTDQFIGRCMKQESNNPDLYGVNWQHPALRARIHEVVTNMVSDLWEGNLEREYESRFFDMIEFAMANEALNYPQNKGLPPPNPEFLKNTVADRMLTIHRAFMVIDEAIAVLHPSHPSKEVPVPIYNLLFGSLSNSMSLQRSQFLMDEVVFPLTNKSMANVIDALGDNGKLTDSDQNILYKALIDHVTKDTALVIKYENQILYNWLASLPPEIQKDYMKSNGALSVWLMDRVSLRLEAFYPSPDSFFDSAPSAGALKESRQDVLSDIDAANGNTANNAKVSNSS